MFRIPEHLQRTPQSGVFYFRLTVPERLRHIVGRREIKRSLRTGLRAEAVVLAQRLYVESRSLFSKVECQMSKKAKPEPYTSEWIKENAAWGWAASKDINPGEDRSEGNISMVEIEQQESCDVISVEDSLNVPEDMDSDPDGSGSVSDRLGLVCNSLK